MTVSDVLPVPPSPSPDRSPERPLDIRPVTTVSGRWNSGEDWVTRTGLWRNCSHCSGLGVVLRGKFTTLLRVKGDPGFGVTGYDQTCPDSSLK